MPSVLLRIKRSLGVCVMALCVLAIALPVWALAEAGGMTAAAGTAEAEPGDTIVIPVTLTGNPGIASLKVSLYYDNSVLEPVSASVGPDFARIPGTTNASSTYDPVILNWMFAGRGQSEAEGVFGTVTFRVREGAAPGVYSLPLVIDPSDVFDESMTEVPCAAVSGRVTVTCAGDVNGDGAADVLDAALLLRYAVGLEPTQTFDAAAADAFCGEYPAPRAAGLLREQT